MNNLQKAKEIIEEIKRINQEHCDFNGQLMKDCGACYQIIEGKKAEAIAHKEEIKKGCGIEVMENKAYEGYGIVNAIKNPASSINFLCGKNGNFCKNCQEALKLYKEVKLWK